MKTANLSTIPINFWSLDEGHLRFHLQIAAKEQQSLMHSGQIGLVVWWLHQTPLLIWRVLEFRLKVAKLSATPVWNLPERQ